MRFTTFSAVTNVFIVYTVALLSLIPSANAQDVAIIFYTPQAGETYQAGEMANVTWNIAHVSTESEADGEGRLLMEGNRTGYSYLLAEGVSLRYGKYLVTYPAAAIPSNDYYLSFQTIFGNFTSDIFIIQAVD